MPEDLQHLFSDLARVEIRLYNVLHQRLRIDHGLAASQFALLRFIDQTDNCRVGDIARELVITVGAASKSVDRLESSRWVVRRPNPHNRRSSLLELTAAGHKLLLAATATVDGELHRFLDASLSKLERARFAGALASVLATLDAADAGQPTG
jgi:DNA-binding MarR family transcriptional regulator